MIFNDYDVLNMKLDKVPNYGDIIEEKNTQETVDFLDKQAAHTAKRIHNNQINLILKNKFKQLRGFCLKEDPEQSGIVNIDLFKKIMQKLEINKK